MNVAIFLAVRISESESSTFESVYKKNLIHSMINSITLLVAYIITYFRSIFLADSKIQTRFKSSESFYQKNSHLD